MLEIRNKGKEVNPQELRDFYELVISSYHNDFLDELVDQRLVGDWAQRLQIRYREMFWQILWDMAKYEGARGAEKQQEEQRDCFKRAARLYERYAFETAPRLWGVPKGEKYSRLSEHALRQSMHYYLQAGDDNSARHVRYRYDEMMKRQNEVDEEDEA